MRNSHYKQIMELLKSVGRAQEERMYADCQAGALAIGNFIESVEGEGTQTVSLLEEYCEQLYLANRGEAGKNKLRKSLTNIENCIRRELKPEKLEILFLSYNASMSDAILSIYQAAKVDPHCDAYWMPIPYWERKSDKSVGSMHFDGAECYRDIVCVDYRQYDIEKRRPDVIVTFAPYDEWNRVTSVHSDFYCKRLRKLTDLLVYVPYYVTTEEGQLSEGFCTVPGCMYAHRVIAQSERIRSRYIRLFKEAFGDLFGRAEKKFISLGSPKFDAVINTGRGKVSLPEPWEQLLKKADERKIVLYNTSIGALLSDGEQNLRKMRDVLEVFRARNDVILWWRPHPLLEATFSSMIPQLSELYQRLVSDYKQEGWGIYDDTPDLHRAIAMSDAYYGDYSSIVALYSGTGKPMAVQNIYRIGEDRHCPQLPHKEAEQLKTLRQCVFTENEQCCLPAYLDYITKEYDSEGAASLRRRQTELFRENAAHADGTAGKAIYEYIKKSILG